MDLSTTLPRPASCRTRSCRAPRRWSTTSTRCGASRTRAPRRSSCTRSSRSRSRASSCATFVAHRAARRVVRRGALLLPAPRRVRARARRLPRAAPPDQGRPSRVPVIASLNGTTLGGWLEYARLIEQAGADALELNVYAVAGRPARTRPRRRGAHARAWCARVKAAICDPARGQALALLLVARRTSRAGSSEAGRGRARALQPLLPARHRRRGAGGASDAAPLDSVGAAAAPALARASSRDTCAARWRSAAACTPAGDAIKAVMAGAHAVQMVSALLRHGPEYLAACCDELARVARGARVRVARADAGQHEPGLVSGPAAYERANYMLMLQGG